MLADDILEDFRQRERERAFSRRPLDVSLAYLSGKLPTAVRFAFDREATGAAATLAFCNPIALRKALEFIRLPAPLMWLEYANADFMQVAEALGHLTIPAPAGNDRLRSGYLVEQMPDGFRMHMAVRTRTDIVALNCYLDFSFSEDLSTLTPEEISPDVHKRMGPDNIAAICAIANRKNVDQTDAQLHFLDAMVAAGILSEDDVDHHMRAHYGMMGAELRIVVALLLLLTMKDGISYVDADLTKLNKARARNGNHPLLPYRETRIRLGRLVRRRLEKTYAEVPGDIIHHWRNGHFKVWKTGIFWWNGHWVGDEEIGTKAPRYRVIGTSSGPGEISKK